MTSAQRKILSNASSDVDRARLFNLMTTGKNLQGFVGDKSFNVGFGGAGTTSSYMGSINSQISRSMGYSANAGNGFSAMAYGASGMGAMEGVAVAGTAFNTAMTAVNAVNQIGRMGGGAFNMARGFMGGGGEIAPVSQAQVGMSNISAHSSLARKGAIDSLTNISRQIKVQQQYGNLPSHNGAWGQLPSGGASGGNVVSGSGLPPL